MLSKLIELYLAGYEQRVILTPRCEPFDTYPRTYDLLHAAGLFSIERKRYAALLSLFGRQAVQIFKCPCLTNLGYWGIFQYQKYYEFRKTLIVQSEHSRIHGLIRKNHMVNWKI